VNTSFDFKDLYVFEMANNHQGQLEHGRKIIQDLGKVAKDNGIRAAIKFQFRQMDTFIHPDHKKDSANKHIPRFLSTRLTKENYADLLKEVRKQKMVTMCTPFDEESVDMINDLGIEVIKIGSCSAKDWPLIERIADANKPVIFSTGGLTLKEIDDLVSFFDHRRVHFAIMHCVAVYPTPDDQLQLNQIDTLKRRYRDKVIGFSSHEAPESLEPVMVAVAKGARMLERHVGVETTDIKLNPYSGTPGQIDAWVKSSLRAKGICGAEERPLASAVERDALDSLQRGIFAKADLKAGTKLERKDVYFAMPWQKGQLDAGKWKAGIVLKDAVKKDGPVTDAGVEIPQNVEQQILYTAVHEIKGMLNEARIALAVDFQLEFSHHYGVKKFREIGTTIINCVNRDYAKKILVMLPNQQHPSHFHKRKEETFQVLHGVLDVNIDGRKRSLYPGDILLVGQGVWHSFSSKDGAIFEEISSTHFNDDSYYEDKEINKIDRSQRKTTVQNWGRYQI
jgi:N-acetylneuraminate synthase